ncbi:MAG: FG-GAP-like repeat-containing protein [Phycisphaerales bacterium]|nr:FG-GAP-like repeat-containing protein [Phycisphaerales bacterium]
MTARSSSSRFRIRTTLLSTPLLVSTAAIAGDWLELTSTELPLDLVQSGIDLTFVDEAHLLVLRPQDNAVTRITWDTGLFLEYTKQATWNNSSHRHYIDELGGCLEISPWCHECTGTTPPSSMNVPVSDGLSIDSIAGDTVISHSNRDSLSIHSGSIGSYYYVCGAPTGDGEPIPIGDYEVGGDGKAFGLVHESDPGFTTGLVLGTTRTKGTKGTGTRGGSGSTGGGPYPGVDTNWALTDATNHTSLSADNATADFDGDGFEDLVILHPDEQAFSILPFLELAPPPGPNTKSGAIFGDPISFAEGEGTLSVPYRPHLAAAGDFDGDGSPDLAVIGHDTNLFIYAGDGAFGLSPWTSYSMPETVGGLEAADLDGDGRVELILAGGDRGAALASWTWIGRVLADGTWDAYLTEILDVDGPVIALDAEGEAGSGEVALLVAEYADTPQLTAWGDRSGGQCDVDPSIGSALITSVDATAGQTIVVADGELAGFGSGHDQPPSFDHRLASVVAGNHHLIALDRLGEVVTWRDDQLSTVPPEVEGLEVHRIAAGAGGSGLGSLGDFHAVITSERNVVCWGMTNDTHGLQNVPLELQGALEQLDAGSFHVVARTVDGNVAAWGNSFESMVPDELASISRTTALLAPNAGYHFLALSSKGALQGWGKNDTGELDIPADIGSGTRAVIQATTSASHSFALLADDSVVSWGITADYGQYDMPMEVGIPRQLAAGYWFTSAVSEDGTVRCWGYNGQGQCDIPADVGTPANPGVQVATGVWHSAALLADGSVVCWGRNTDNNGFYIGSCDVPAGVGTPKNPVAQVAAGLYHTVALFEDGSVTCWGANYDLDSLYVGQCDVPNGIGTPQNPVVQVDAGLFSTVALLADGTVACWGANESGQCDVPAGLGEVTAITAAWKNTAALLADGSVECWGDDSFGQLSVPAEIANPLETIQVAAGARHSVVLLSDGSIRCFGFNFSGCCDVPAGVGDPGNPCIEVAAGDQLSVALMEDGTITCWGLNDQGQCDVPVEAQGQAISLSVSYDHCAALLADQTVACWGTNGGGQCDVPAGIHDPANPIVQIAAANQQTLALRQDGTMFAWGEPMPPLKPVSPVVDVAVGNDHAVAIGADGVLTCWGTNGDGQLDAPQDVGLPAMEVASSSYHNIAWYADDSIRCWGRNDDGECDVPIGVASGDKPVASIAAGGWHNGHSMVLFDDGNVVCWGANQDGQCDVPLAIQGTVIDIAAGESFSLALLDDGTVRSWGDTEHASALGEIDHIIALDADGYSIIAMEGNGTIHTFSKEDYASSAPPHPIDSTLVSAGDDFFVAFGRAAQVSGHLIEVTLEPLPSSPDINGDGVVDGIDLAIILGAWGNGGGPADLDGDGDVSGSDLAIILGAWGPYRGD